MSKAVGEGSPEEVRQRLIQRSMEDEELRQRLLADPKAAIEQELGTKLPEEAQIRAVEETPEIVYLVLPPSGASAAAQTSGELSDQELESVAGGWNTTLSGSTCGSTACDPSSCNDPCLNPV